MRQLILTEDDEARRVKIRFDPQKLLENVFQLILLTLYVLYNIPKVYQDLSTESYFSRWPPKYMDSHESNYSLKFDDLGVYPCFFWGGGKEHMTTT